MSDVPFNFASALALGLLHSLEPSHAKAVLASYFLNQKRTAMEAVVFAVTVTLAHTLSIYVLAILGYALGPLFPTNSALETGGELLGGGLMVAIGLWMFWNERKAGFHKHENCGHDHSHGHFFHHHHYRHDHQAPSSWRQIFFLGACSGAIPCASGLVVLMFAWTTASPGRGLALVAAFSLGLGIVVLTMCVAMQQMARFMDVFWKNSQRWTRFLPVLSSAIILLMGIFVLIQGAAELGGATGIEK